MPLPDVLEIEPIGRPIRAVLDLPGSKSLTNRALVLGALAEGTTRLFGTLHADDTRAMVQSLERLGFAVHEDPVRRELSVLGEGGRIPASSADLYGGNAGTAVRFLTSLVALGRGRFRVDGDERMRQRPIQDLLDALVTLGAEAWSERGNGCPPVIVEARGLGGGEVEVRGDTSSQYASSILMVAPYARRDVQLRVTGGLVGAPFVEMTLRMMEEFGVRAERRDDGILVRAGSRYQARDLAIEPDATAASYFFAAAVLVGGEVTVRRLGRRSLQGDLGFLEVLAQMGARVVLGEESVTVVGDGRLRGIDRDFRGISDTFLTAAALAPFAESPSTIRGIAHTRHQETDRVTAMARELRRLGATVEESAGALRIFPSALRGGEVETYRDHRIAMSLALVGLRIPGIRIRDPGCVAKTFPDYFERLRSLGR
jgi:3-phosphoshikimate 1-carboxyvinyltransferase